ncbi:restriction endonuclease subunit S [Baaleninema simplex]|uniref:restriction endonuclease subunit S n=1 Tax=Baaleninema simplex TaxID=2862350 RepID=UPI0008FBF0AC|nr:restriction endonuclease subunit S [Baaleninema simplex]
MKGWTKRKLGAVCTLQRGFDLPKKSRKQGCYPLFSSSGCIDTHSEAKVKSPNVVTGRSGSIGSVFFVDEDFWPLNTTLYVKDFHGNNPRFIFYLLKNLNLNRFASGSGVPTLNRNIVHKELVKVPCSLSEQKQIVAILDEAFEGIDRAIANTEKNLANARELFESYLNAIFTQKGDDWIEKTLKEVSTQFGRGKSKHRPRNDKKLYGGQYPFIQTGDIRKSNHIISEYSQTYNEVGLAQSKLWPKGTVCITIAANIAETGVLDFNACVPDSIICLVVDDCQANNMFVEYMLQAFKVVLQKKRKGSAQDNINMGTFKNQLFPFPDIELQKSLVSRLDALSEATQRLESIYQRKLEALQELKQSILHKAFTGELTNPQIKEDVA